MTASRAHGSSFPIFFILQGLEEKFVSDPGAACFELREGLGRNHLLGDLSPCLVFRGPVLEVGFDVKTPYGREILSEIMGRFEVVPCAPGPCKYGGRLCWRCKGPEQVEG